MTTAETDHAESISRMRDRAGTADPATLPHSCRCGARWSGYTTSHCGACNITFSGVSTFDRHRRNGRCLTPAAVGMSLVPGRPYECWGFPGDTQTDVTDVPEEI